MKHRLMVKIEKRFKRQLSKRFNPRNAQNHNYSWMKSIVVSCLLCEEHMKDCECEDCPFKKFQKDESGAVITTIGCVRWIERIVGKEWFDIFEMGNNTITWSKHDNKKAIELLKKLREKAKKYIIWTENTK